MNSSPLYRGWISGSLAVLLAVGGRPVNAANPCADSDIRAALKQVNIEIDRETAYLKVCEEYKSDLGPIRHSADTASTVSHAGVGLGVGIIIVLLPAVWAPSTVVAAGGTGAAAEEVGGTKVLSHLIKANIEEMSKDGAQVVLAKNVAGEGGKIFVQFLTGLKGTPVGAWVAGASSAMATGTFHLWNDGTKVSEMLHVATEQELKMAREDNIVYSYQLPDNLTRYHAKIGQLEAALSKKYVELMNGIKPNVLSMGSVQVNEIALMQEKNDEEIELHGFAKSVLVDYRKFLVGLEFTCGTVSKTAAPANKPANGNDGGTTNATPADHS